MYCGEAEVSWVQKFLMHKAEGAPGLLIEGLPQPEVRCQAICAALIRNFTNAQVVPLKALLDRYENGDVITPTVILVPNLFAVGVDRPLPGFRIQALHDLLIARSLHNRPTVVYVEDMVGLTNVYGKMCSQFLKEFHVAN